MYMLISLIVWSFQNGNMYQNINLYTLDIHNCYNCQLYFNKVEKKKNKNKSECLPSDPGEHLFQGPEKRVSSHARCSLQKRLGCFSKKAPENR